MQHRSDGLFRGDLLHIGDRRVSVGTFALIKTTFDRKVPDIPYPASGSGAAGSPKKLHSREKKSKNNVGTTQRSDVGFLSGPVEQPYLIYLCIEGYSCYF